MVLRRLTYGANPASQAEIAALGVAGFIEQQLAPASISDGEVDQLLDGFSTLGASNLQNVDEDLDELRHALVLRALASRRQLLEVMVDVWDNHFTVALDEDGRWRHLDNYKSNANSRAHALGTFAELVSASAHSPAMLVYLDNYKSNANSRAGINENYGRELLELHTVGIIEGQQVYTEEDVRGVGLVLSAGRSTPPTRSTRSATATTTTTAAPSPSSEAPGRRRGAAGTPATRTASTSSASWPGTRARRATSPGSWCSASSPTRRRPAWWTARPPCTWPTTRPSCPP
ncbi:MAG: DUF1800 family protein [Acidimicrobiia bacterium]|nr:DUF1800 family protein [Acidimicrobiia bacterium]